jgi:hypothetical protein
MKIKQVKFNGKIGEIYFSKEYFYFLRSKESFEVSPSEFKQLIIKNPALWWPTGYGKKHYTIWSYKPLSRTII